MGDAERPLSVDDARILALQSTTVYGHTLKLLVLAPGEPLDLDALRRAVAERIAGFPRALDRVEHRDHGPVWVRDDALDLDHHVRAEADVDTADAMRQRIGRLMSTPLDPSRPLWTVDVLGPLDDGSQAIAVRLHHAIADGMGGMRFLESVLLQPHEPERHAAGIRPRPVDTAWTVWEQLPGVLWREFGHPGSRSPFDRPLTPERELAFAAIPLAELHEIGRSRPEHTTVNDVLLAVVAGALRRRLAHNRHVPRVRAQIPVSLHEPGEDAATAGNRDSFLNIDLLLREPDELRRLDGIRAQTQLRKRTHDPQLMDDVFRALAHAGSAGSLARLLAENPREYAVAVSNVPGPNVPVAVSGRAVTHLYSSSEPGEHHALRISAASNDAWMGVGLCVDPTAVADVPGLAADILGAYADLRHAALGDTEPIREPA